MKKYFFIIFALVALVNTSAMSQKITTPIDFTLTSNRKIVSENGIMYVYNVSDTFKITNNPKLISHNGKSYPYKEMEVTNEYIHLLFSTGEYISINLIERKMVLVGKNTKVFFILN